MEKPTRLTALKKLHPTCNFREARGTPDENRAYCTKLCEHFRENATCPCGIGGRIPGTEPFEEGVITRQGQRVDLDKFKHAVLVEKKRKAQLVEDYLTVFARYPRLYDVLVSTVRPPTNPERKVVLLCGKPGTGKTRYVYDRHGDSSDFWDMPLSNGTPWFDRYDGHKIALLDDFEGASSRVTLDTLLRLLDIYPVQVPQKGSFAWWSPDIIYITCNLKPTNWYKFEGREDKYTALIRRFTEAHYWANDGTHVHLATRLAVRDYFPYEPPPTSASGRDGHVTGNPYE